MQQRKEVNGIRTRLHSAVSRPKERRFARTVTGEKSGRGLIADELQKRAMSDRFTICRPKFDVIFVIFRSIGMNFIRFYMYTVSRKKCPLINPL